MEPKSIKKAFILSLPILCSYLFVGTAYGIMMEEAGLRWYYSFLASYVIYTGAFQFVLITLLSSGASILTIAVTAFLMSSRQAFYSLTFMEEFRTMGKRMPYMIRTMSDETYAVNCSLPPDEPGRKDIMYLVALFSRCYWIVGSVIGGILGQIIPFELEGIDFCMTALFLIILIDQWEKRKNHLPALLGLGVSVVCLLIFGEKNFILPSLLIVSGILIFLRGSEEDNA